MTHRTKTTATAAAALLALSLAAVPALADDQHHPEGATTPQLSAEEAVAGPDAIELAHAGPWAGRGPGTMGMMGQGGGMMGPGAAPGYGPMGPGTMGMMGQGGGMMGPGAAPGYGPMGPGTMGMMGQGSGMMGPGMMGMMGQGGGMMGPGMMGPGAGFGMGYGSGMGYGPGPGFGPCPGLQAADLKLSADDVRARLEQRLARDGNPRLKLGEIKEVDKDAITAEIVTTDGSLVDRLKVDRHTGATRRTD
ncbi:MAG: hypothetical protein HY521_03250 [Proteobacteria bacterium]|nr:hypothetical protein [Pseudomonadota bacterium]